MSPCACSVVSHSLQPLVDTPYVIGAGKSTTASVVVEQTTKAKKCELDTTTGALLAKVPSSHANRVEPPEGCCKVEVDASRVACWLVERRHALEPCVSVVIVFKCQCVKAWRLTEAQRWQHLNQKRFDKTQCNVGSEYVDQSRAAI